MRLSQLAHFLKPLNILHTARTGMSTDMCLCVMIEVRLYPDIVLFFFSLFRKTSASGRAKRARASAEREKEKIFSQAEAPKAARKKKFRLLPNQGYPRTTTVNIPRKTASVS